MKKIFLLSALTLTGCVTFAQMDEGLNSLKGKDKKVAFEVLGYPSQEQTFDDVKVYTWVNSVNDIAPLSSPQLTTGTVGNSFFNATTTKTDYVPITYNCKIQIATNTDGVIKSYDFDGNMGGCETYIHRLNNYLNK
ncbi:hypothetical protein [Cedecea sp. HN178]|uniref:hypothetical protein n=1 Tax=Cedecea sp. HN178 TaxID=3081237 RepID=UPI003017E2B1